MSRPGFAYEGYRWENGWQAERTVVQETGTAVAAVAAANVAGTTREMDNLNNGERSMDIAQVVTTQSHTPDIHQASDCASSTAGYSQVSDAGRAKRTSKLNQVRLV